MTEHEPIIHSPSACFQVDRQPGKGYQVTSAEGHFAQEWKGRALSLLDMLGQPDPNGPDERFQWVGPIPTSGEYVGVSVKLMPNGEVRYVQAWFQVPKLVTSSKRMIRLLIIVVLLGFCVGVLAGRTLLLPGRTTGPIVGGNGSSGISMPDPPREMAPQDLIMPRLQKDLAKSRGVRSKLSEYLSQDKFREDFSTSVVDEKRSVKLIADLDKTPPLTESIRFSNIEVAKLVNMLKTLDEWANTPNQSGSPDGR